MSKNIQRVYWILWALALVCIMMIGVISCGGGDGDNSPTSVNTDDSASLPSLGSCGNDFTPPCCTEAFRACPRNNGSSEIWWANCLDSEGCPYFRFEDGMVIRCDCRLESEDRDCAERAMDHCDPSR